MIDLLLANPLLLLFVVVAIGYPLGRLKVGGVSLGVAAVLFAGLAVGALHPDLKLPDVVYQLGAVVFVYTIGLASGRGFFGSLRRRGLRDNAFAVGVIGLAAVVAGTTALALGQRGTTAGGLFAGALNNTPALAAALDYVASATPPAAREVALAEPIVGYSLAYPFGVVGVIAAILIARRLWRIDDRREAERARDLAGGRRELAVRAARVTRPSAVGRSVAEVAADLGAGVAVGRIVRDGHAMVASGSVTLAADDLVTVVGAPEVLDRAVAALGEPSDAPLTRDRGDLDFRRVFVSNPRVAGRTLRELALPERHGATITRLRRGDVEFVPGGDTALELGDRVRVVTTPANLPAVSAFLGDSYRGLSEIDILTFSLGIGLGLLVGLIPIPLPGGLAIKLGFAGGPLLVGLALGALGRSGPLVWHLPYSANLTLRQFGLTLFLAGVGTRAGYAFRSTLGQGEGLAIVLAGAAVTTTLAVAALVIGYQVLRLPFGVLIGMVAGVQTQPALLGFALEQTGDDLPTLGYASVYPTAMILKILIAQLLVLLLPGPAP